MILIRADESEIEISGHSGYAPIGSDIVCAGVSALFVTLVESLEQFTDADVGYRIEPGDSYVAEP